MRRVAGVAGLPGLPGGPVPVAGSLQDDQQQDEQGGPITDTSSEPKQPSRFE